MPEGNTAVVLTQTQNSQSACDILLGPQDPYLCPECRAEGGGYHALTLVARLRLCPFCVMSFALVICRQQ